jgi:two-component system phosphate regulon response regulator OmpR
VESQAHVVVCDDDGDIRDTLAEYLEGHGYAVTPAEAGPALRAIVDSREVHAVILDVGLPGEDGLSLARYLSDRSGIGIIMLTGAGETVDRIVGLEMGADDYLAKPVDLRELLARLKAVLRRLEGRGKGDAAATAMAAAVVPFGRCSFDIAAHKLVGPDGEEIAITAMEFSLLKVFAEHAGRVLNRDQLLELAHDRGWDPYDRSIDIRISRLRKKIETDPTKPEAIRTVRGVGYVFARS